MGKKLRAVLIAVAIICFTVAIYDPAMRFLNNRSMDAEMDDLRSIKQKALEGTASTPGDGITPYDSGYAEKPTGVSNTSEVKLPSATDEPGVFSTAAPEVTQNATGSVSEGQPSSPTGEQGTEPTNVSNAGAAISDISRPQETPVVAQNSTQNSTPKTGQSASGMAPTPLPSSPYEATGSPTAAVTEINTNKFLPNPTPKPRFVFDAKKILPEYRPLYDINPDLIGWLKVDGTVIDYPVVRNTDPEYYLYRDFYGKHNINGLLILSANCDPYTPSMNVVISGHNMNSGKMFGALNKYASKSYGMAHAIIQFDTLFTHARYKLIAAFYTRNNGDDVSGIQYNVNIQYRRQMIDFLQEIDAARLYDTGVDVDEQDELLTLSTCSYQVHNGRFVVIAKRVQDGDVD